MRCGVLFFWLLGMSYLGFGVYGVTDMSDGKVIHESHENIREKRMKQNTERYIDFSKVWRMASKLLAQLISFCH